MTITFSSHEFEAAMKGTLVVAYPPGEHGSVDEFAYLARVPQSIISPADAAKTYWRWDVMPKTMHRLA